ncbi:alpha/beta fold hydrolase [Streptomyces pratens]|uniref:Alpha/beta fold hydrolase n=1 Tax=Streptomyces pratens TaxID=887456 RepID=A0ABW1MAB1_9ACTN
MSPASWTAETRGYITTDDLARLIESLDLRDAILVGHSRGSDGLRRAFWLWSMQAGLKGAYDCIAQLSGQDFTGSFRAHAGCRDAPAPPPCNLNHVNILSYLRREEEGCLKIHGRPQLSGRSLNG